MGRTNGRRQEKSRGVGTESLRTEAVLTLLESTFALLESTFALLEKQFYFAFGHSKDGSKMVCVCFLWGGEVEARGGAHF